jgi:hypothetical protein
VLVPAGQGPVKLKVDINEQNVDPNGPTWNLVTTIDTEADNPIEAGKGFPVAIPSTVAIKFECQIDESENFEKTISFSGKWHTMSNFFFLLEIKDCYSMFSTNQSFLESKCALVEYSVILSTVAQPVQTKAKLMDFIADQVQFDAVPAEYELHVRESQLEDSPTSSSIKITDPDQITVTEGSDFYEFKLDVDTTKTLTVRITCTQGTVVSVTDKTINIKAIRNPDPYSPPQPAVPGGCFYAMIKKCDKNMQRIRNLYYLLYQLQFNVKSLKSMPEEPMDSRL